MPSILQHCYRRVSRVPLENFEAKYLIANPKGRIRTVVRL